MNPAAYIPEALISSHTINPDEICYSLRLNAIKKRKLSPSSQGTFSNLMSGLSNAITSAINEACFLRMNNSEVWIVSEKTSPIHLALSDVEKSAEMLLGEVKVSLFFPSGEIESALYTLTSDNFSTSFGGSLKQFAEDFSNHTCENMCDKFYSAIISKNSQSPALYSFSTISSANTLISYDSEGIYLINHHKRINFSDIVVAHQSNGYCEFIFRIGEEYMLAEIFNSTSGVVCSQDLNLIRDMSFSASPLPFRIPETILHAENFLSAFLLRKFAIISADNKLYFIRDNVLLECGIFKKESDIYIKTIDGKTVKYSGCERITEFLSVLPSGFSSLFLNAKEAQPFLCNGSIVYFTLNESALKSEIYVFEFSKMENCRYNADDFSCTITFTYEGNDFTLCTANPLGIQVCKIREKSAVSTISEGYTMSQLYDTFYSRLTSNHLACTFSEIIKTDRLLSIDSTPSELIAALYAEDSPVLRNTLSNVISKFKNIDDLQSVLIQKVTLLEIQRKKIQKLFDEWTLYYPHYHATMQVQWLKHLFGSNIESKATDNEYWKCVRYYKRVLSSCNAYVQDSMSEIALCTDKISDALPDEAKRTDITPILRINSNTTGNMLHGGTDILMAATAGLEITNFLLNGLSATNPLAISMTAKNLVDSYTKDVNLRKDIRTFSLQSLEWWEIFKKGLRIQVIELSKSFENYNKLCIKRDTDIYEALPESSRAEIKERLYKGLKEKISESIDDKFTEILPQFNLRISNIIEEIDLLSSSITDTLDEFQSKLFM